MTSAVTRPGSYPLDGGAIAHRPVGRSSDLLIIGIACRVPSVDVRFGGTEPPFGRAHRADGEGGSGDTAATVGSAPAGGGAPVRVSLLRKLTVTVGGVAVTPEGHLQRRLITALAVGTVGGSGASVDDLVDAVYGEDLPPRPRRALATLIWRLRQTLGNDAVVRDDDA